MAHLPPVKASQLTLKTTFLPNSRRGQTPKPVRCRRCWAEMLYIRCVSLCTDFFLQSKRLGRLHRIDKNSLSEFFPTRSLKVNIFTIFMKENDRSVTLCFGLTVVDCPAPCEEVSAYYSAPSEVFLGDFYFNTRPSPTRCVTPLRSRNSRKA